MHMLTSDVLAAIFTYFFFDDVGIIIIIIIMMMMMMMMMKWMGKIIELIEFTIIIMIMTFDAKLCWMNN